MPCAVMFVRRLAIRLTLAVTGLVPGIVTGGPVHSCVRRCGTVVITHIRRVQRVRVPNLVSVATVTHTLVTSGRVIRATRRHRTKVLAAEKDFLTPVSMFIEVTMTPTIGPGDPDIRVAIDEHDISIQGRRDIDIVRLRQNHLCRAWRCHNGARRRGTGNHYAGPHRTCRRLNGDLPARYATTQEDRARQANDGLNQPHMFQAALRIPPYVLATDIGRFR
jgi:hypothetical protein